MIDDLLARVKQTEDEALDDAGPRLRAEERVLAHARQPRPKRAGWQTWLGGGLLAAAVILLSVMAGRELAPVERAARASPERAAIRYELVGGEPSVGGYIAAPEAAALRFDEGTEVALLAGARARVLALRPTGADLLLESGSLAASVTHTDESDWRFHAGPFAIVVIGTRFSATWAEGEGVLDVAVEEGVVRVEGSCLPEARVLRAGDAAHVACAAVTTASAAVVPSEASASAVAPTAVALAPSPRVDVARSAEVAVATPVVDEEVGAVDTATLIEDAQRAALAGDLFAAEQGLRAVRDAARGTDDAALAAFLLGRLAFDEQHAYGAAADWFATYLAERPSGRLAREAMGRELEARERALDGEGARSLAARYLERFPEGPHAERAARILGVATE